MPKFQRLSSEERKKEIKTAASALFLKKGFSATTMENIVSKVSLSKGGVYRFYSSTQVILSDLIIDGMHLRNAMYEEAVKALLAKGCVIDIESITEIISNSMLIGVDHARLYVIFLYETMHNAELRKLYEQIVWRTNEETLALAKKYDVAALTRLTLADMTILTNLMNTAILGIVILNNRESFLENISLFKAAVRRFFVERT